MTTMSEAIKRLMRLAPVIPVPVIEDIDHGLPKAQALAAGGMPPFKDISAPLMAANFRPTGGVTPQSAPVWRALEAVNCAGGSGMVPEEKPDVAKIEAEACPAAGLGR